MSLPPDLDLTTVTDQYIRALLTDRDQQIDAVKAEIEALQIKQTALRGEAWTLYTELVRREIEKETKAQ